jgi:DNA-binding winged helix-turn-helix (wHTH) protein
LQQVPLIGGRADLAERVVIRGDLRTAIPAREAAILGHLVDRVGRVVTRRALVHAVWDRPVDPRVVDNTIRRLRSRIEPDPGNPVHIRTVRQLGYRFVFAESENTRTNLERDARPLVGRAVELAELEALLGGPRAVVSLLGPAGMGKTRLARELGRQLFDKGGFRAGVWWVPLSQARNESDVLQAMGAALGLPRMEGRKDVVRALQARPGRV